MMRIITCLASVNQFDIIFLQMSNKIDYDEIQGSARRKQEEEIGETTAIMTNEIFKNKLYSERTTIC